MRDESIDRRKPYEKSIEQFPWNAILGEISDPAAVVSTDYRLIWANRTLLGFLGADLERLNGRACYEFIQKRKKRCPDCPVSLVFDSGRPAVIEKPFRCEEGSLIWREIRAYPIRATDGTVTGALRIGFDVTERKALGHQQTRRLDALEKSLSELTETARVQTPSGCASPDIQPRLTTREIQVLRLLAKGLTNTDISGILDISPHTVKSHVTHVFDKLGVGSRTDAAVTALHLKLI
jgi:PAS domain S-box-containing protein